MASHTMQFLQTHRECWVDKTQRSRGAAISHTFLDSTFTGKIHVPWNLQDEWCAVLARDVDKGSMEALNELRTDFFRFYADFDMYVDAAVDPTAIAACANRQVARFVPAMSKVPCVVLASPVIENAKGDGKDKVGVHMHWPTVVVTTHEALLMRELIVVALEAEMKRADLDWAEAYDNEPYNHDVGGLRMVGAPKTSVCGICGNKATAKKECRGCTGKGKVVDRGRQYALHAVVDKAGEVDADTHAVLARNAGQLVRHCSVRSQAAAVSSEWTLVPGCPRYSKLKERSGKAPIVGSKRRTFSDEPGSRRGGQEVVDGEKLRRLTLLYQKRFHPVYANVCVKKAKLSADGARILVELSGEGESYCLNKGASHTSNRVYGVVDRTRAWLRCHSSKPEKHRPSGMSCKDFGMGKALTVADKAAFFSDVASGKRSKCPFKMTPDEYLASLSAQVFGKS